MEFYAESWGACYKLNKKTLMSNIGSDKVFYSRAISYDTDKNLKLNFEDCTGIIPHNKCAIGISNGEVKDIAIVTRVGRNVCFTVENYDAEKNIFYLSRLNAQTLCKQTYLDKLSTGDIINCQVTHIESFGAFCDIGCGISALLPIDCMSVSRISSPSDRVHKGQALKCVVKNIDTQGRFVLSLRELLGTWEENAQCYASGETVIGTVRSVQNYGVFIELAPNLVGLSEYDSSLKDGDSVSVYIKSILYDKMKIKLVVLNKLDSPYQNNDMKYFIFDNHIDTWQYSNESSQNPIYTNF